jgi:hypothetical protein
MTVHAAGRVPEINGLNLDAAGIEWEKRGVRVNEFLQSVSIPAGTQREMPPPVEARRWRLSQAMKG